MNIVAIFRAGLVILRQLGAEPADINGPGFKLHQRRIAVHAENIDLIQPFGLAVIIRKAGQDDLFTGGKAGENKGPGTDIAVCAPAVACRLTGFIREDRQRRSCQRGFHGRIGEVQGHGEGAVVHLGKAADAVGRSIHIILRTRDHIHQPGHGTDGAGIKEPMEGVDHIIGVQRCAIVELDILFQRKGIGQAVFRNLWEILHQQRIGFQRFRIFAHQRLTDAIADLEGRCVGRFLNIHGLKCRKVRAHLEHFGRCLVVSFVAVAGIAVSAARKAGQQQRAGQQQGNSSSALFTHA